PVIKSRPYPFRGRSQPAALVSFGAILGHATVPLSFLRHSFAQQAASSYPAGNGSVQIRRRITPNTRRVSYVVAQRTRAVFRNVRSKDHGSAVYGEGRF